MRPTSLFLIVPLLGVPAALFASPQPRAQAGFRAQTEFRAQSAPRLSVRRALFRELGRATPDHVEIAKWRLTSLEIQSHWALAGVTPLSPRDLDPFTVLLHQTRGTWKVATLGTNLRGSGKQFGAPRALWKKWGL